MLNKQQEWMLELFYYLNAINDGHFLLSSGRHSSSYIQCAEVLKYPWWSQELARNLVQSFQEERIDFVIGPAVGGITIAYEVARQLNTKALFAERVNGKMTLKRFEVQPKERALVVEDVVTTGGSAQETIDLMEELGCQVLALAALVKRGGHMDFSAPFFYLLEFKLETFNPDECPLCAKGVPLIKPGSRL